jgi:hypothetical protein
MVPPKLVHLWEPKIQVTVGKVTWHAIYHLESNVFAISRSLYETLDIGPMKI